MEKIPNAAAVAERLRPLSYQQLEALARLSGVPFHTLLKIKSADTGNPRIDTVSKFWPFVDAAARVSA